MNRWCFALMVLAACKSKRAPLDTRPLDQLTSEQVANESKEVKRGENIGALLRSPRIVVTATAIEVNEARVVDRTSGSAIKGGTFVGLVDWMSGLNKHWMHIHSNERFDPSADVTFPSETSLNDAAVVLWSVARGGYSRGLVVHAGDATARFNASNGGEANTGAEVALFRDGPDWKLAEVNPTFEFGFLRPGDATLEPCQPARNVDASTVAAAMTAVCDRRGCGQVSVANAIDLHDALSILGPALQGRGLVDAFVTLASFNRCR